MLGGIAVHTKYRCLFFLWYHFLIPQYRCHLNNARNATLLERGLFSLLHFGEDTAVCVTKREAVALVERDEREEEVTISTSTAPNIHRPLHQLPRLSHTFSTIFNNFQTLLAAFPIEYTNWQNLATFLDKPYGWVRRYRQSWAWSLSLPARCCLSLRPWAPPRRRISSSFSWSYCSRAVSKGVQHSVSKHRSLTDSLEL